MKYLSHPTCTIPSKVEQGIAAYLSQPHVEMPTGWRQEGSVVQGVQTGAIQLNLKPSSGPCSWGSPRSLNSSAPHFLFYKIKQMDYTRMS